MTIHKGVWAAVLAATLAVPVGMAYAGEGGPRRPVPTVRVEKVGTLERSEAKSYIGTVAGEESVNIVARVAGTLWKAPFQEGAVVKAGDVLYEIEDTVYKANVQIAHAAIKQIEAELELARKEHARSTSLLGTKAVPERTFDESLRALQLAEARLEEAKANVVLAENDLSYTKITAPLAGRIGENIHSVGNYITPSTGVMATIVQFDPVKVKFSMSEADFFRHFKTIDQMVPNDIAIVRANGSDYTGKAAVSFVDNQVDARTGTITIHLTCANPDSQLLPGGYVRVRIAERFEKPLPAVSSAAIMTDGKSRYVYMLGADNKVVRRDIKTGPLAGGQQTVLEGLAPGETVIVGGMNKVRPGAEAAPVGADNPVEAAR